MSKDELIKDLAEAESAEALGPVVLCQTLHLSYDMCELAQQMLPSILCPKEWEQTDFAGCLHRVLISAGTPSVATSSQAPSIPATRPPS
ncbi:hypothetical protein Tco_0672919 [Tanacetum coccineum]